jgi:chromosomal replication initiator protein
MRPEVRITQQDIAVRDHVLEIVCQVCGDVTAEEVLSQSRAQRISFARHLAMCMLIPKAGMTTTKLGMLFGRSHATVVHAHKVIDEIMSLPRVYANENKIINQARELHTSWT